MKQNDCHNNCSAWVVCHPGSLRHGFPIQGTAGIVESTVSRVLSSAIKMDFFFLLKEQCRNLTKVYVASVWKEQGQ